MFQRTFSMFVEHLFKGKIIYEKTFVLIDSSALLYLRYCMECPLILLLPSYLSTFRQTFAFQKHNSHPSEV